MQLLLCLLFWSLLGNKILRLVKANKTTIQVNQFSIHRAPAHQAIEPRTEPHANNYK